MSIYKEENNKKDCFEHLISLQTVEIIMLTLIVKQMKESNKMYYTGTRDDLISQGYDPCGNCHP